MSRADRGIPPRGVSRPELFGLFVIHGLVILSVVPWRTNDLYSGGVDPVVISKAIVGVAALVFAFLFHRARSVRGELGPRTIVLLLGIVLVSVLGALAAGGAGPDIVLAVRLLITAGTLILTVRSAPGVDVIATILAGMGAIAIVAGVTGGIHLAAGARLSGGVPQMQANVLAGLAAGPAIALGSLIFARGIRFWSLAMFFVFVALIFATGSRTALVVVLLGVVVAFLCAGRLPISTVVATIAVFPFAYAVVAFTNTVANLFSRGESITQIATLNSRTVAWEAVLATPFDSWAKWIGVGLAAQTVAVQQRWRDIQVLDSSWVSVIAQAGIIGTLLLVIWMVATGIESLRNTQLTALTTPLFVMLFVRSFTENGLIESSPTFVLFFALSMILERRTHFPSRRLESRRYQLATLLPITRRELQPASAMDSADASE